MITNLSHSRVQGTDHGQEMGKGSSLCLSPFFSAIYIAIMLLLLFIVFLGEFSMNWRRMERLQKWRRMVRQQKGKLYIMRICITMLICRRKYA